jgi:hypothetical protein
MIELRSTRNVHFERNAVRIEEGKEFCEARVSFNQWAEVNVLTGPFGEQKSFFVSSTFRKGPLAT